VRLFFIQNLNGKFLIVPKFLQQISYFLFVEMRIFFEDDLEVTFQFIFVGIEGVGLVGDYVVLANFHILG
jgi:hypothetical protein